MPTREKVIITPRYTGFKKNTVLTYDLIRSVRLKEGQISVIVQSDLSLSIVANKYLNIEEINEIICMQYFEIQDEIERVRKKKYKAGVSMKLIVGLGNPGREYENTRHNAGFKVMEQIEKELNVSISMNKFKGLYVKTKYKGEDVILLKPQTYMNLSGESVKEVMTFFKIDVKDILVIYDDLDLPVGKIRLREKGSAGGQNGMKNIIQHVGTQQFNRIRVGIGKDPRIPTVDYVLGKFRKEEVNDFEEACIDAKNAALYSITNDFNVTMNKFNKK